MDTRSATEDASGVLDSTSSAPKENNAVDAFGSGTAVENTVEIQVKPASKYLKGLDRSRTRSPDS